jgi:hypothetical protein
MANGNPVDHAIAAERDVIVLRSTDNAQYHDWWMKNQAPSASAPKPNDCQLASEALARSSEYVRAHPKNES